MNRRKKGFTLAELLIVVAIIAVLAAIAIPVFASSIDRAKEVTCIANRRSLLGVLSSNQLAGNEKDLQAVLAKLLHENSPDVADWENVFVCPAGGAIRVRGDAIRCDIHRANDYQNSTAMLDRYKEIQDAWTDSKSKRNDEFRNAYFNKYCSETGTWPQLQVGDKLYYAQPYVDSYATGNNTASGDMFLFANTQPSGNGSWNANCIYDAEEDEWYTAKNGKAIGIADKSWSELKELMTKNGWVKTDAIEIDPIR